LLSRRRGGEKRHRDPIRNASAGAEPARIARPAAQIAVLAATLQAIGRAATGNGEKGLVGRLRPLDRVYRRQRRSCGTDPDRAAFEPFQRIA
jgi:hypothetical protein